MKFVINSNLLKEAGSLALGAVMDNTSKGIDRFGKPFKPYSNKPFAMPYGAFLNYNTKTAIKKLNKNDYQITGRNGKLWIVVKKGYKFLKQNRFKSSDSNVNLQVRGMRGGMLGNLVLSNPTKNSISIKFRDSKFAELAYYHTTSGASKSRVIRDFMGITPVQQRELENYIADKIIFVYP